MVHLVSRDTGDIFKDVLAHPLGNRHATGELIDRVGRGKKQHTAIISGCARLDGGHLCVGLPAEPIPDEERWRRVSAGARAPPTNLR